MSDRQNRLPKAWRKHRDLPRPRRKKFALLLSNRQIHRLCRRMERTFR